MVLSDESSPFHGDQPRSTPTIFAEVCAMVQRDAICVANAGDSRAVRESRRGIGDRWVLFSITLLEVQDMIDYIYILDNYIFIWIVWLWIYLYIYMIQSILYVCTYGTNIYIYTLYIIYDIVKYILINTSSIWYICVLRGALQTWQGRGNARGLAAEGAREWYVNEEKPWNNTMKMVVYVILNWV